MRRLWLPVTIVLFLAGCGGKKQTPTTPDKNDSTPVAEIDAEVVAVPVAAPDAAPAVVAPAPTPDAAVAAPQPVKPKPAVAGETYMACGCGCCGGMDDDKREIDHCLYRSKGDSLDTIRTQDAKARKNPRCAVAGCSRGTLYGYCD